MIISGWIIIGILIVLVIVLMFKSQDVVFIITLIKKHMFYIVLIAIALFFTFSLNHIHKSYSADLTTFEGIVQAGKVYLIWMKSLGVNLAKVTGYAAHQDWFNVTNSTLK